MTAILIGLALIVVSLIFYDDGGGSHQNGMEGSIIYGLENMILGIVGAFLMGSGTLYLMSGDETKQRHLDVGGHEGDSMKVGHITRSEGEVTTPGHSERIEEDVKAVDGHMDQIVLRLLEGDDRRIFLTIKESGGEVLQKDLIEMTKMSNAKVTRVLDRLEDKGLIVKERHGMTNKVRIEIET